MPETVSAVLPQSPGNERWDRQTEDDAKYAESRNNLKQTLDELSERLQPLEFTSEKQVRAWLKNHGVINLGMVPVQELAAARLLARYAPNAKATQKLQVKYERVYDAFVGAIQNVEDPGQATLDERLLSDYVNAQLSLAQVIDDLARSTSLFGPGRHETGRYHPKTLLGNAIDPSELTEMLSSYTRIYPEASNVDAALVEAALQTHSGQDPNALRNHFGQLPGKGKRWSDDMRRQLEIEVSALQAVHQYLEGAFKSLNVDTRRPIPRRPEEIESIEEELLTSFPYTPTEASELTIKPKDLSHANPMQESKTKTGRPVKIQGADSQSGDMYFLGPPPDAVWETYDLEGLPSGQGSVPYTKIPQRNIAAYITLKGLDIVPVTIGGKQKVKNSNGQVREVNLAVQEIIPDLKDATEASEFAPGERALAWVCEYMLYNRDRNAGNISVVKRGKQKGKAKLPDNDFTGQARQDTEPAERGVWYYKPGEAHPNLEPPYDEPIPDYAREWFESTLTDDEIERRANIMLKQKLLPRSEVQARKRRMQLARELIKKFGHLPSASYQNRPWDYLNDPRIYDPSDVGTVLNWILQYVE